MRDGGPIDYWPWRSGERGEGVLDRIYRIYRIYRIFLEGGVLIVPPVPVVPFLMPVPTIAPRSFPTVWKPVHIIMANR